MRQTEKKAESISKNKRGGGVEANTVACGKKRPWTRDTAQGRHSSSQKATQCGVQKKGGIIAIFIYRTD